MRDTVRALRPLVAAAVAVTLLAATPGLSEASGDPATSPRTFVTGWLPYWLPSSSTSAVVDHASVFDEASPFWFSASPTSVSLTGSASDLAATISSLKSAGVPVVPTVTTGMDADRFAALLSHRAARHRHEDALRALAAQYKVAGLDLDYENINFGSSSAKSVVHRLYPVMVKELAADLHADGRILSVTVPARRSDSDPNWSVYDYGALGAHADRFRIMTYDYSWGGGPPGPIAPIGWVDSVVGYAVTRVDPLKISIGVPAYGRDWFVRRLSGSCPASAKASTSGTTAQLEQLAADRGITPTWDATSASRTFTYRQRYSGSSGTCVAQRRVWYDDAKSLAAKMRLVTKYQVRGVAVWAFGGETPGFWSRMGDYSQANPVGNPDLSVTAPDSLRYGAIGTVAGLLTVGTQPVAGQKVRLYRRPLGGDSWVKVGAATSDSAGQVAFTVSPRRHMEYRLTSPQSWSVLGSRSTSSTTRVRYSVSVQDPVPARTGGTTYLLSGAVGPDLTGVTVVKQRFVGGSWVDQSSQVVGDAGAFSFHVHGRVGTTKTFRVVADGASLDPGASRPVSVTFS